LGVKLWKASVRVYKTISFSVVILLLAVLFADAVAVPTAAQTDTMQSATIHGTETVFGKPNPLLLERVTEATGSRKVAVGKDIPRAS
jgi:K+-transporting ATPase A subunit